MLSCGTQSQTSISSHPALSVLLHSPILNPPLVPPHVQARASVPPLERVSARLGSPGLHVNHALLVSSVPSVKHVLPAALAVMMGFRALGGV